MSDLAGEPRGPAKVPCDLCGQTVGKGRPFIILNRYIVGDGEVRRSCHFDDGEWDPQKVRGDGTLLCVSPCLVAWIEGALIEGNFAIRSQEREE